MPTLLPKDTDNNVIQALRFKQNGAHKINVSSSSTTNTTAFEQNTRVTSLYCDVPIYIAQGSSDVTASNTDHYLPAGLYYDVAIGGDKTGQSN